MQVAELDVRNPSGLHARPAAQFVKTAAAFRSKVSIENLTRGSKPVNAKSLLSVLGCGVENGHRILVSAEGEDEEAAIEAVRKLADGGFGEAVGG
ncbi:MAG: HPr family phosphocarrier protein [Candidatus Limnocylindrales bacterium]|jgi:phosphotransferase system HPr (HPr) family protein